MKAKQSSCMNAKTLGMQILSNLLIKLIINMCQKDFSATLVKDSFCFTILCLVLQPAFQKFMKLYKVIQISILPRRSSLLSRFVNGRNAKLTVCWIIFQLIFAVFLNQAIQLSKK